MKRAVAIAILTFVTVASAIPALAQRKYRLEMKPQRPPGTNFGRHYEDVDYPTPEKRAANLAELLNLTDDQKQKVQAIFVEQDKQGLALWSDQSLTDEARTKKIAEIRDAASKKVRDLLTDEQRKKYDALGVEPKAPEKIRMQPDPRG
jgi:Spy/CpxP family protein refolding chaperone